MAVGVEAEAEAEDEDEDEVKGGYAKESGARGR